MAAVLSNILVALSGVLKAYENARLILIHGPQMELNILPRTGTLNSFLAVVHLDGRHLDRILPDLRSSLLTRWVTHTRTGGIAIMLSPDTPATPHQAPSVECNIFGSSRRRTEEEEEEGGEEKEEEKEEEEEKEKEEEEEEEE